MEGKKQPNGLPWDGSTSLIELDSDLSPAIAEAQGKGLSSPSPRTHDCHREPFFLTSDAHTL